MNKPKIKTLMLACLFLMPMGIVIADEDEREYRQMYGWQLMTPQEREQHRIKMQSMETKEERKAYRYEHHEKMEKRAKEQGATLPDEPRERERERERGMDRMDRGDGRGMGSGGGRGMGSGGSRGGGGGRR